MDENIKYKVEFEKNAYKSFKKIDRSQRVLLLNWIEKNLVNTTDPRLIGKSLKGNLKGYWRYRVGSYRIVADINDNEIKIIIVEIGHRKDIYKK